MFLSVRMRIKMLHNIASNHMFLSVRMRIKMLHNFYFALNKGISIKRSNDKKKKKKTPAQRVEVAESTRHKCVNPCPAE